MAKNTNTKDEPVNENPPANDGAPSPDNIEKGSGDAGQTEVQERTDEAEDKGYIGVKTDPKPNTVYSQEGGMPV